MTATLTTTTDPSLVLLLESVPATASTERSAEFLSCAKTALKIGKKQHQNDPTPPPPNAWWQASPADLRLLDVEAAPRQTRTNEILQDGLALLRTMEAELKQLESLVRRGGQTNDPTQAIAASTRRLEEDTKELTAWLPTIIPPTIRRNGQAFKHYTMIQEWFQQAANEQGKRLQEILKVRGKVLTEQARRRKLFQATSEARTGGSSRKPVMANVNNNPLFQLAKPPTASAASVRATNGSSSNSAHASTPSSFHSNGGGAAATPPTPAASMSANSQPGASPAGPRTFARPPAPAAGGYTYYAAKPSAGGYGATPSPYAASTTGGYGGSSGMRQRRAATAATMDSGVVRQQEEQTLMLQRQQERQSQQRLREAREAEKGLASLVGLFGKMSVGAMLLCVCFCEILQGFVYVSHVRICFSALLAVNDGSVDFDCGVRRKD